MRTVCCGGGASCGATWSSLSEEAERRHDFHEKHTEGRFEFHSRFTIDVYGVFSALGLQCGGDGCAAGLLEPQLAQITMRSISSTVTVSDVRS